MTRLAQFWQGRFPLSKTFWLGWAVPVVGGNVLLSVGAWWVINHIGLIAFYIAVALVAIYTLAAVIPVWRSAATYTGHRLFKYGARGVAAVTTLLPIVGIVTIAATLIAIKSGNDPTHDPERIAEKTAIPSASHPLAGFWKTDPSDNFGLAIAPAEGSLYSVSFCGPGGCFKPGSYRPNTPIVGDESYQVISSETLRVRGNDGWTTYTRSPGRGGEDCPKP
ncbi:hypothetical protein [Azospira restricta]|uniref:Uncharacterized protein n=2 Tax=Azospira restricta TaxID=404405 RepID=A0A974Y5F5_9RHOO|nr:hypothetical protein [Azospira restricta]QRJ65328.1 hypothetical protein IWH25_08400 [Azospira restricta]